jgi:hypothetical protein
MCGVEMELFAREVRIPFLLGENVFLHNPE